MSDAATILSWLRSAKTCALSTLLDDAHAPGFPFGTVVPYDVDDNGTVSVVISNLAVHTKNLAKDPRCSLVVAEPNGDPQAGWRVTLVGTMRALPGEARDDLHGFVRYVLDVKTTRYIAGFGRMGWL